MDRALSEEEATALDSLARAHLMLLAKLGASPIREAVNSSTGHTLPFGERDRALIGFYRHVVDTVGTYRPARDTLNSFLRALEPDVIQVKHVSPEWIRQVRRIAGFAAQTLAERNRTS